MTEHDDTAGERILFLLREEVDEATAISPGDPDYDTDLPGYLRGIKAAIEIVSEVAR